MWRYSGNKFQPSGIPYCAPIAHYTWMFLHSIRMLPLWPASNAWSRQCKGVVSGFPQERDSGARGAGFPHLPTLYTEIKFLTWFYNFFFSFFQLFLPISYLFTDLFYLFYQQLSHTHMPIYRRFYRRSLQICAIWWTRLSGSCNSSFLCLYQLLQWSDLSVLSGNWKHFAQSNDAEEADTLSSTCTRELQNCTWMLLWKSMCQERKNEQQLLA